MRFSQTQKPPLGTLLNLAHPLSKGLVGLWLMNEGSGNKIYDLSNNGINGLLGTTVVPQGGDIYFPATQVTNYIDLGSTLAQLTKDWTISIWFKRNAISASAHALWSRWVDSGSQRQIYLYLVASNKLQVDIPYVEAVMTGNYVFSNTETWYHAAVIREGSSWKIYANGFLDNSATSATAQEESTNVYLGRSSAGTGAAFPGFMRHVSAYNRALSAQEVQQLYINPYAMFEQRPVWMDYVAAAVGNRRRRLLLTRRAA